MNNLTSKLSDAPDSALMRRPRCPAIVRPIATLGRQHDHAIRSADQSVTDCDALKEFDFARKRREAAASLGRKAAGVFSRRGIQIARALLFSVGLISWGTTVDAAPTAFANVFNPVGVETDRAGNVYVDSDNVTSTVVTKFTAAGANVAHFNIGGFFDSNLLGHIARIPSTDFMVLLTSSGKILVFTTDVKPSFYLDLSPLNFKTATALDVTSGSLRSFTLGQPSWGDIAAFRALPNLIYFYLTATTNASGGNPFVLRLALDLTTNTVTWTVVATSSGTTAGLLNQPRGIAVNNLGWVLTGFPFAIPNVGFADSLVAFKTSFPEVSNAATRPQFILRDPTTRSGLTDMASVGMSTDVLGNFYIATGPLGSSKCGTNGSGALVLVQSIPTTPNPRCLNLPAILASSRDVAVSPVGNIPYMTVQNLQSGLVVRFDPLVVGSAPAGGVQGTSQGSWAGLRFDPRGPTLRPQH